MKKTEIIKEIARMIKLEASYNIKTSKLISQYYSKHINKFKKEDLEEELGIATIEMGNSKEQYEQAKYIYENPKEKSFF